MERDKQPGPGCFYAVVFIAVLFSAG